MDHAKAIIAAAFLLALGQPDSTAPGRFMVRLETTKGRIDIEVHRDWAPRGADRFYDLVRQGYYDGVRFHRVVAGRWAQFGINGDPRISTLWRDRPIEDDPFVQSNQRGTIAYAFAVANGRTTQVFINLRDNSETHDREPFVPFGRVVAGMDVVDSLFSGYGETSGGGIRAGKQAPLFERGNVYLDENFPRLDHIQRATVIESQGAEKWVRTLRERSEPGREEASAPKARNRGNPAVLPERGARGASRAKSEASPK